MNLNDGFGGNNSIQANLMWNMCRESGDHGPVTPHGAVEVIHALTSCLDHQINSWDRMPFLTELKYGPDAPSYEAVMNDVSHNLISANYGSSQGFGKPRGVTIAQRSQ